MHFAWRVNESNKQHNLHTQTYFFSSNDQFLSFYLINLLTLIYISKDTLILTRQSNDYEQPEELQYVPNYLFHSIIHPKTTNLSELWLFEDWWNSYLFPVDYSVTFES